jgi:hypothetical protein
MAIGRGNHRIKKTRIYLTYIYIHPISTVRRSRRQDLFLRLMFASRSRGQGVTCFPFRRSPVLAHLTVRLVPTILTLR